MPRIDAGKIIPGWGCVCPAFRLNVPEQRLVQDLARSSTVNHRFLKWEDGVSHFEAWSGEAVYQVVFDPHRPGGSCKHVWACAPDIMGEFILRTAEQARKEIAEWQKERKRLTKAVKDATKEIGRLGKEAEKAAGQIESLKRIIEINLTM